MRKPDHLFAVISDRSARSLPTKRMYRFLYNERLLDLAWTLEWPDSKPAAHEVKADLVRALRVGNYRWSQGLNERRDRLLAACISLLLRQVFPITQPNRRRDLRTILGWRRIDWLLTVDLDREAMINDSLVRLDRLADPRFCTIVRTLMQTSVTCHSSNLVRRHLVDTAREALDLPFLPPNGSLPVSHQISCGEHCLIALHDKAEEAFNVKNRIAAHLSTQGSVGHRIVLRPASSGVWFADYRVSKDASGRICTKMRADVFRDELARYANKRAVAMRKVLENKSAEQIANWLAVEHRRFMERQPLANRGELRAWRLAQERFFLVVLAHKLKISPKQVRTRHRSLMRLPKHANKAEFVALESRMN